MNNNFSKRRRAKIQNSKQSYIVHWRWRIVSGPFSGFVWTELGLVLDFESDNQWSERLWLFRVPLVYFPFYVSNTNVLLSQHLDPWRCPSDSDRSSCHLFLKIDTPCHPGQCLAFFLHWMLIWNDKTWKIEIPRVYTNLGSYVRNSIKSPRQI